MTTTYEPKNKEILDKCLAIISKPVKVVIDSHSADYLKRRNLHDKVHEAKLLNASIDDASYYDELSKGFDYE